MAIALPQSVLAARQSQAPCLLELIVRNLYEEIPSHNESPNKWTIWIAFGGLDNGHTAQMIDRVIYELPPPGKQRFVTTYPPFFFLSRRGWTPFTARCNIHWNPILGMRPTEVDHSVVFGQNGNRSVHWIDVDRAALDTLGLGTLANAPNGAVQLQLPSAVSMFNALGIDGGSQRVSPGPVPGDPLLSRDRFLLEVVVGNRHKVSSGLQDGDRCHEWTVYVTLPEVQASKSRIIEHVVYNLHPPFSQDTYTKHSPNLELICLGWENFRVTCTIHWNPLLGLQPTELLHEAVSDEPGGQTLATISVSPRRLHFLARLKSRSAT